MTYKDPPSGWYMFGTHAGWDHDDIPPLEFSKEQDEAGVPYWERPVPVADDRARVIAECERCPLNKASCDPLVNGCDGECESSGPMDGAPLHSLPVRTVKEFETVDGRTRFVCAEGDWAGPWWMDWEAAGRDGVHHYEVAHNDADTAAPEACPRCGSALQVDVGGIATCTEESCGEEWWPARAPAPVDSKLTKDERQTLSILAGEGDDYGLFAVVERILAQHATADPTIAAIRALVARAEVNDTRMQEREPEDWRDNREYYYRRYGRYPDLTVRVEALRAALGDQP